MSRNAEVAALLEEMADRLEALDVDYKPRAYRQAAENVRGHTVAVETLAAEGQDAVEEIDRVGEAIAAKIVEYVETGSIAELEELREQLPVDIEALTRVEGVGPKTVADLYEALGVQDLDDLEAAAEAGEIQEVKGFGAKTEQNILDNIAFARESHERQLLGDAQPLAERVMDHLRASDAVERVETAGSLRRWRPTVGDVDVLVATDDRQAVVDRFVEFDAETIEAGTSKASLRANGIRVDLRVVVPDEWGSALLYFTGSKDHNIVLRNRAIERELKVNEYGVFDVSGVDDPDSGQRVGERVAGETEAAMYAALELPYIAPEMREDRGEVAAAAAGELPDLIDETDVRGDLHLHTEWSDGDDSVAEMVAGAEEFGHDYIAISDHATGPGMVGGVGVDDDALLEQAEEVRAVAADADVRVFTGVEANIAPDGSVSVADDVLAELDCVVASPHASLDGDGTDRLVAACEHPEVNVLGHPTGRLLNQRPGLDFDVEAVAEAAAANDTALEINANPHRLDLSGSYVKRAIEAGATLAIDTDAHTPASYGFVRFGVHTARRGWAEPADVLTTREADDVAAFLGL
ncbi:DNA polymerase/3'-5' exonuclease PolX [Halorarius halobius]|uniref:DNA polymerase/3'-5' exonuclease PolX n=1 Tax=Halorarius halobius TaxID=2962671 RepID=UPI0020CFD7DA|nr:DNA polymerase/3'-5' exonuclease PolX [Halorarius halobius]